MCGNTALLENGSSGVADDLLDVSTSYVRHDIRRLKERLNTRLLNRSKRTVRLTDMKHIYYERIRVIHDQIEAQKSEMRIYKY